MSSPVGRAPVSEDEASIGYGKPLGNRQVQMVAIGGARGRSLPRHGRAAGERRPFAGAVLRDLQPGRVLREFVGPWPASLSAG